MFFPLEKIEQVLNEDVRDEKIREILAKLDKDDPPFLSNLLVHADENAALHVMEILASGQYPFVWRIQHLRTEWGDTLKPGDKVTRAIPINRVKRDGDLITPREMSKARKDGSFSKKFEQIKEFKLDDKNCFTCGYSDAVYFLHAWGYNRKTNTAVTGKPEYSHEPVDMRDPTKGQKKHIRYWRYAEIDRKDYAALMPIEKGKKG
jgi:hypothetical protein